MKTVSSTNDEIRKMLEDLNDVTRSQNLLVKEAGPQIARAVKRRYNEFMAFPDFGQLIASGIGKLEPLKGNFKGYYSIRLTGNYRLIFRPGVSNSAEDREKQACEVVLIEGVVDYHGKGNKIHWLIP